MKELFDSHPTCLRKYKQKEGYILKKISVFPVLMGVLTMASPVENLISAEYGKLVLDDSWHVLSSPARWSQNDWLMASLGTGAVVVDGVKVTQPF